jgi:ribokinase
MYDVITVGSATVDVFVDTVSQLIKIKSVSKDNKVVNEEELLAYPAGAKILIKNLDFQVGGGGTNTAVALRRLGLKVGYLGKLGNDDGKEKVLSLLRKEKIDFLGTAAEGMTAYSIILDSIEQDRTILAYKGVVDSFSPKELNPKKLDTGWFYFSALVDNSYKVLEYLSDYAHKRHIKLAFNPSLYLAEKGQHFLSKVLRHTTLLILNKEEAEAIIGKGEIKDLLYTLHRLGPEITVITDGKTGAYCFDGKEYHFIQAHKVKVRETTGAGDAFASSFLFGLIRKNSIHFALQLGLANAESVILGKGAKTNLLTYPKILERIRKNPAKITKI